MAEGSAATTSTSTSTSSSTDDASSASAAAAGGGSSMNGDASPRSRRFRQRSMINAAQLNGNEEALPAVSVSPFNVERDGNGGVGGMGGMRVSQSMAKLEMLEQQQQHQLVVHGSVDPVVVMKTIFYVLVWYTFSTCLTLYNKTLLGDKLGKFPAPLLMNTFHFTLQAVLSKIIVYIQSRKDNSNLIMSWKDYFIRVVPTALGTALDINLSNASLVFISVTFATMCKSASPIFLLLFAFAFRLESPSVKLLGIILIISMGVLLTVAKETEFEFWGFVFVMMAAVMSGFRWSMTQILLQKEAYGLRDPITLMSYVTPVMAVATFIGSLLMDPWDKFDTNIYFNNPWHVARSCLLMLIGGTLAFFMVLIEYVLVSVTSAITVTIAGVVKEAVTIVVAVLYFHDKFTVLKGVGLVTIMVGVSLFNWYKYEKLKKGNSGESEESIIPLSSNGDPKYVIIDEFESLDSELES